MIAAHLRRKFSPIGLNYTFEHIGPSAKEALPTLEQDLTNKWDWVRLSAAKAIIKIAPDKASVVVPVLHELQQLPLVPVYSPDAKVKTPVAWKPNPDSNYFRWRPKSLYGSWGSKMRLRYQKLSMAWKIGGTEASRPRFG
jgi:hypothetical protein